MPLSDPNAKYASLQFTEDEVLVKPWDPNDADLIEMAKSLIPIQIQWIARRENAIEKLLWSKFEDKIKV